MNSPQYGNSSSSHIVGLTIVVGLHLLAAYVVITGSAQKYFAQKSPETILKIVELKPPPPPDIPPLKEIQKQWAPPKDTYVPMPEITIAHPVEAAQPVFAHITSVQPETKAMPTPVAAEEGKTSGPGLIGPVLITDGTEELEYPWTARQERQEGAVLLMLLIDDTGKVIQSKVIGSSGSSALDEAARVGIALCKFKPGTEYGVPKKFWKKLRYIWDLPN